MGRAGGPKKLPKTAPETKREGWIEERLARGQRPTAVCLAAVEEWGISEATAWRYIAAVRDRWAAEAPADRSKARAEVLAQVDHLIASISSVTNLVNDQMARLDQITDNADQIMIAVNQRRTALTELIGATRSMIRQLNDLAATNNKPMHQALTRMRSVVDTLVAHRKDLDRTLEMAGPAMRMYTNSLGDGPWLGVNAPYFVLPDSFYCLIGSAKGCA